MKSNNSNNRTQSIFLSPHADDICYSAFGSIYNPYSGRWRSLIVTVFSKSCWTFWAALVKEMAEGVTHVRQQEERGFAGEMGCDLKMLGFEDSSLRNQSPGDEYKGSDPRLDPVFPRVVAALRAVMAENPDGAAVFVPLGNSNHLDHLIVRDAALEVLKDYPDGRYPLFYYEDLPYAAALTEGQLHQYARSVNPALSPYLVSIEEIWHLKEAFIRHYRSQLENSTIRNIKAHALAVGGTYKAERIWYVNQQAARAVEQSVQDNAARTCVFVSWEAGKKYGGIGEIIQNIITSEVYAANTILLGPMFPPRNSLHFNETDSYEKTLAWYRQHAVVHYPPLDDTRPEPHLQPLRGVEEKYKVKVLWIKEQLTTAGKSSSRIIDKILIDLSGGIDEEYLYSDTLPSLLVELKNAGIEVSHDGVKKAADLPPMQHRRDDTAPAYRHDNDFAYGLLLAGPAAALIGMIPETHPTVVIAQDYFSLPTAYKVKMDSKRLNRGLLKTLYYASEVKPVRNLIEGVLVGRDREISIRSEIQVENLLRNLLNQGKTIRDLQDDRTGEYCFHYLNGHADLTLIQEAYKLDRILTASTQVFDQLRFLSTNYQPIGQPPVFFHGLKQIDTSLEQKQAAKQKTLQRLVQEHGAEKHWNLGFNYRDTYLFARTGRPMPCKAMHRDLLVLKYLDKHLQQMNRKAVYVLVTGWLPGREAPWVAELLSEAKYLNRTLKHTRIAFCNNPAWPAHAGKTPSGQEVLSREEFY